MEQPQDIDVDVAELTFTVWEDEKVIWQGSDYKHAFFLRNMNRETRKVTVNAKVDITLEDMGSMMTEMHQPIKEQHEH